MDWPCRKFMTCSAKFRSRFDKDWYHDSDQHNCEYISHNELSYHEFS